MSSAFIVEGRIGSGSVEVLRRMLEDEEAAIDDQEDVDECKDSTRGSIPTGVNENLKCKKIKKLDRCEEEYDGKYLYGTYTCTTVLYIKCYIAIVLVFQSFSFFHSFILS